MVIRKNVLRLAVPIMVEQTFVMLLGVFNTMMAGHIGEEAVSAIGMVDSLNNIFISFFAALSVGATVVVAQQKGKDDLKQVNETVKQALISGLIISSVITMFMWIFRVGLINSFYGSATELVKANAKIYIEYTLITYPFIAIEQIANGILRGCGDTKTPMIITIFMNIINIILGYILIYGIDLNSLGINFSTPSFGISGAAIAIAIARLVGTVVIISNLVRGSNNIKLRRILPFKFDIKVQKEIFGIGVPAGVEQLLFNAGKFIVQVFIVTMGTVSIASNTIGMSICQIPNVLGNSLAIAATTLVGQYVGRNDVKGAKGTLIYLCKFATVFMVIIGIICVPLAPTLASLYTDSEDVISLSATLIRANGIAMVIWPISFVFSAGLKGAGDTRYTMVTAITGMWLFRILIGYLLGVILGLGVLGIWIGMFSDWLVRGSLYSIRLKGTKWLKHRIV
ncbi:MULTISPECIES: MATE family efflux transporter [Clostridium]|uniref:Probable multidrug resistance protein NorM n=1 Tax=Clostridium cibarium TaxID=2762247 RepID=A0ABR8PV09_9CLOT|nr:MULTISPECIES: MATE family efflux transporter [Clostridium]MBD7912006.1 MATE family efflux transporter [Clostridium cibarium]